jgi:hypothetical protein
LNVFQQLREEEPSRRVVHTRIDHSTWDHWLSSNPHALAIYLEFVPTHGAVLKRFEECQCEDDDVRFHCRTWVPGDGHYRWLKGPINPLSMEHWVEYLAHTICRIWIFCNYDLSCLNHLLSCNSPEATQVKMLIFKVDFDSI